ncbi:MAG: hypothetical protein R6V19_00850, partial [Armatimonadota bacterium]
HVGTVEEVEEETRSALQIAKEVGGCIIGCSNQVVKGTPEQNFWAMMEILTTNEPFRPKSGDRMEVSASSHANDIMNSQTQWNAVDNAHLFAH